MAQNFTKDFLISFFLETPFLLAFLKRHAVFLNELDFSSVISWRKKRRWAEGGSELVLLQQYGSYSGWSLINN